MITYNPCKVLNIADKYGVIEKGFPADLVVFDAEIRIQDVFVNGNRVRNEE